MMMIVDFAKLTKSFVDASEELENLGEEIGCGYPYYRGKKFLIQVHRL